MRGYGYGQLTGTSPQMLELKREIDRVARSSAKVLITGESGVGKELVAREVHARSLRAQRTFVPVNCAGLPETLLESELFGHVKGSFTGAYRDKVGKLELAHEGTIFLDEVGEMTLRMQGLLLRFLETGELQKVGTERTATTVNVRVIAATNADLPKRIAEGQFREDLYYRLNVINLNVPPLRVRKQDIASMVEHFLQQFARPSTPVRAISPDAMAALAECPWPGNVRQLENVIERLVVVGHREVIELNDLPAEFRVAAAAGAAQADAPRAATSPRSSIPASRRTASRSGRRSIPSTCSATSRAPTCARSCGRGSKRRAAATRSWSACSTWTRATTRSSSTSCGSTSASCRSRPIATSTRCRSEVPCDSRDWPGLADGDGMTRYTVACALVAAAVVAAGASQTPPAGGKSEVHAPPGYVIGALDVIEVLFWRDKDLSAEVVVRPDGKISLPLLNEVEAGGLTPEQLRFRVLESARRFVEDPTATVDRQADQQPQVSTSWAKC